MKLRLDESDPYYDLKVAELTRRRRPLEREVVLQTKEGVWSFSSLLKMYRDGMESGSESISEGWKFAVFAGAQPPLNSSDAAAARAAVDGLGTEVYYGRDVARGLAKGKESMVKPAMKTLGRACREKIKGEGFGVGGWGQKSR